MRDKWFTISSQARPKGRRVASALALAGASVLRGARVPRVES